VRNSCVTRAMATALAIAAAIVVADIQNAARAQARGAAAVPVEFTAFLAKVDAAQIELQNGRAAPFKALWSHADDVTLSGGFGGTIEKGWTAVSSRLDWVGTQFSNGTNRIERVVANVSGDLGYAIQLEHLKYRVPGETADSSRDYRVTIICRREEGQWRLVHRQADSQMTRQSAR